MQMQTISRSVKTPPALAVDSTRSVSVTEIFGECDEASGSSTDAEPPEPAAEFSPGDQIDHPALVVEIMGEVGGVVGKGGSAPRIDSATCDFLRDSIQAVAACLGIRSGVITVNLINDAEMIELHESFCGLNSTTDVLTFDLDESAVAWRCSEFPSTESNNYNLLKRANPRRRSHLEVDLALCINEAARQADERSHPIRAELLLYAVHGLLHCLGHDDHEPAEFELMHQLEDEILTAIGLAAVFRSASNASSASDDDQLAGG